MMKRLLLAIFFVRSPKRDGFNAGMVTAVNDTQASTTRYTAS